MHWGVPLPCILANAYALGNVVRATNHKNRRCAHLSIALVQRSSAPAPGPRPAYASLPNFIGPSASRAGRRWCQDDNDLPAGKNPCRPPPAVRDCRRRCPQPAVRDCRSPTQPQPAAAPINRSLRSVGLVRPPSASPSATAAAARSPPPPGPRPAPALPLAGSCRPAPARSRSPTPPLPHKNVNELSTWRTPARGDFAQMCIRCMPPGKYPPMAIRVVV